MNNKAIYVVYHEYFDPNGHPFDGPRSRFQDFTELLPALAVYTRLKEEKARRLTLKVVIDISPQ